ncbi:hypothetical protein Ccrd_006479 [Cynara cardunculus var. scolymus]|uniref:Protein TIC 214 n=1 Tax=Cynara cardunculus var. scolymus TaxID=59895 RepID=A0A103XIQ9_CYNCS|nr:hypothetical protein Ccrd_006479 [Cynara cardunculus var. scolymus]
MRNLNIQRVFLNNPIFELFSHFVFLSSMLARLVNIFMFRCNSKMLFVTRLLCMCLELILNTVNLNFVTFSDFFDNRQLKGAIFSIFVIAITAAEAAIRLAIVSSIYRNRKSTRINQSNLFNK